MKTSWVCLASLLTFAVGCGSATETTTQGDNEESAATVDGHPSSANGTLGAWRPVAAMPTPRANHCSVTIGKWLLVVGGNHKTDNGFVTLDEIHAAPIKADGTLGDWVLAGHTPSPVFECVVTKQGKRLLLIDGIYDDPSKGAQVWAADFSSAGTLGAFTSLGALPPNVRILYSSAWVKGTTLYAMQAKLPQDGDRIATWHADVSNGLGAWQEDDWLNGFRGHPQYAFTGSYIYTLGGYAGGNNDVVADVYGVHVERDGSIGLGFAAPSMPTPTAFGTVVAVDDFLYSVGGKPQIFTAGVPGVASVHVGAYGQLDAWQAQPALPQGRTNHTLVGYGNYLFLAGGGFDGPGLDTVFSAQVRF